MPNKEESLYEDDARKDYMNFIRANIPEPFAKV